MENTIELTGVKIRRSAYKRGDGIIINISGKLADIWWVVLHGRG